MTRIRELVSLTPSGFVVISGDDATTREAIFAGAKATISVTANVAPKAMSEMVAAALKGNASEAEWIDRTLVSLHRDLFVEANPIPAKWALERMGLMPGGLRLPLTELSAAQQPVVLAALRAAEIKI